MVFIEKPIYTLRKDEMKMKKSTPVIIALALMMVLASCKTPSENPASSSGNKPEGSGSVVTTVPGGDSTTTPPAPEPDYLQFAVTEGDFGDLFRDEGKWEGERSVRDQIMSVTNSASDEKAVTWAGVCAGKSFEYETKLRVNSFAGSCVNILLDTETNLLSASVYADKITVNNGGSSADIAFAAGSDWHIYRFSVTDNKAKLWIDGELKGEFTLPENKSDGLLSFSGKSADGSALSYDVNYVKLKTTDESWQRPEARMTEVTSWTYEENFDGDTIPAGWAKENAGVDGEASVKDGCFVLSTSNKGEYIWSIRNDPRITKCNSYVYELKLKADFCAAGNSRVSIFNFMGNGWRIHSQFKETSVNMQVSVAAGKGWLTGPLEANDGNFHTVRYEVKITDAGAECRVFLDGVYSYSCDMNDNNSPAVLKVLVASTEDGDPITAYIDYIKVAVLG